ncbi:MAG TPA: hypothetical protein VFT70_02670 [Nocardioides sp.]|nr:hypothetical protein [Nocardioides sp.]
MGTICFKNYVTFFIPASGTAYFAQGPDDRFHGAVTVTVHPTEGVGGLATRYLEVRQMATRRQIRPAGAYDTFLDIVVRNNAPVGGTGVSSWVVYTSVVTP